MRTLHSAKQYSLVQCGSLPYSGAQRTAVLLKLKYVSCHAHFFGPCGAMLFGMLGYHICKLGICTCCVVLSASLIHVVSCYVQAGYMWCHVLCKPDTCGVMLCASLIHVVSCYVQA